MCFKLTGGGGGVSDLGGTLLWSLLEGDSMIWGSRSWRSRLFEYPHVLRGESHEGMSEHEAGRLLRALVRQAPPLWAASSQPPCSLPRRVAPNSLHFGSSGPSCAILCQESKQLPRTEQDGAASPSMWRCYLFDPFGSSAPRASTRGSSGYADG